MELRAASGHWKIARAAVAGAFTADALVFQLHHHCFAVLERYGKLTAAQRKRVITKHIAAPAGESRDAFVVAGSKPFNIFRIGDQPRRHAGLFGAQTQERLQQIDGSR